MIAKAGDSAAAIAMAKTAGRTPEFATTGSDNGGSPRLHCRLPRVVGGRKAALARPGIRLIFASAATLDSFALSGRRAGEVSSASPGFRRFVRSPRAATAPRLSVGPSRAEPAAFRRRATPVAAAAALAIPAAVALPAVPAARPPLPMPSPEQQAATAPAATRRCHGMRFWHARDLRPPVVRMHPPARGRSPPWRASRESEADSHNNGRRCGPGVSAHRRDIGFTP